MLYGAGKASMSPLVVLRWLKYKIAFFREHPDYFLPDGLLVFTGAQGSGKSMSAVNYVVNLMDMYPRCRLVTNLYIADYPALTFERFCEVERAKGVDFEFSHEWRNYYQQNNRVFPFYDASDFEKYENGEYGVIYLVDEIQLYLGSLESKNINMDVMTEVAQQRKQRKHIVATSQVFGRMAKPLREQFSDVVVCRNYYGFLQKNMLIKRDSTSKENTSDTTLSGTVDKVFWFFHDPAMYQRYDTYAKIQRGQFVYGEKVVNVDAGNNKLNE